MGMNISQQQRAVSFAANPYISKKDGGLTERLIEGTLIGTATGAVAGGLLCKGKLPMLKGAAVTGKTALLTGLTITGVVIMATSVFNVAKAVINNLTKNKSDASKPE